jgi:hypothetical protein
MAVAGKHALRGCEVSEVSPTGNMKVSSWFQPDITVLLAYESRLLQNYHIRP